MTVLPCQSRRRMAGAARLRVDESVQRGGRRAATVQQRGQGRGRVVAHGVDGGQVAAGEVFRGRLG
nr:hypothetical protein [Nocardia seriolae]